MKTITIRLEEVELEAQEIWQTRCMGFWRESELDQESQALTLSG